MTVAMPIPGSPPMAAPGLEESAKPAAPPTLDSMVLHLEQMVKTMAAMQKQLEDAKEDNKKLEKELKAVQQQLPQQQQQPPTPDEKLKPIHHKNVDKPERFDGNIDTWLKWAKSFKRFLKRQDEHWVPLLNAIEEQKGRPVTDADETEIAKKAKIEKKEVDVFKEQLNEYLETYTKGTAKVLIEACGETRSWDAWRQLADKGHSLRKHHQHGLRRKAYFPKVIPSLRDVEKGIATWEQEVDLFTAATEETFPEENRKMLLIDMCPEALRKHLKDKEHRLLDYESIKVEVSDWLADPDNKAKAGRAAALEEAVDDDLTEQIDVNELLDFNPDVLTDGELRAIVRNKFGKIKGAGKGAGGKAPAADAQRTSGAGGRGDAPMDVDHADKQCYKCGEMGHISRNCKHGDALKDVKGGKAYGKAGKPGTGSSKPGPWNPAWGPSKGQWKSWFPGPTMTQWSGWYPCKGKGEGKGGGGKGAAHFFGAQGYGMPGYGMQPFDGQPHHLRPLQDCSHYYSSPGVAMSCVEKRPDKAQIAPETPERAPKKLVMKAKDRYENVVHANRFRGLDDHEEVDDEAEDVNNQMLDVNNVAEFPTVEEAQQWTPVTHKKKTKPSTTSNKHNKTKPNQRMRRNSLQCHDQPTKLNRTQLAKPKQTLAIPKTPNLSRNSYIERQATTNATPIEHDIAGHEQKRTIKVRVNEGEFLEFCHNCNGVSVTETPQQCPKCGSKNCMSIAEDQLIFMEKKWKELQESTAALRHHLGSRISSLEDDEFGRDDPYSEENPKIGVRTAVEIRPQALRPTSQKTSADWEYVEAILDSGATVTVFPPSVGTAYELRQGEAAKAGVMYEVANGDEIPNLGERLLAVMTTEGTVRGVRAQVADVNKPLQAVRSLTKSGHLVVFGDGPDGTTHYVLNKFTGEMNSIKDDGVNYLMGMYIMPPDAAGFGRQAASP